MTRLCPRSKKRKFRSAAAARRSAAQRYGATSNTYRCPHCDAWHITRRDMPQQQADPQVELLADVLIGTKGSS